jgi:hypothetical protein
MLNNLEFLVLQGERSINSFYGKCFKRKPGIKGLRQLLLDSFSFLPFAVFETQHASPSNIRTHPENRDKILNDYLKLARYLTF